MKLTWVITTRGRPDKLKATLDMTLPHIVRDETQVMVCADDDDNDTRLTLEGESPRLRWSRRPREDTRGEKYDRALTECPSDIYLLGVDCVPIVTPGWDDLIIKAAERFPDGIGIINTPMANANFPALQGVTAKMVELLGHTYSHEYPFWFIDHEMDDIARMTGRGWFVNIECQTGPMRPGTTIRMRDLAFWTHYYDMMTLERRLRARAIIDALDEPDWRKEMMKTWHHGVEARSFWVNGNVRAQAAQIEAQRGDKGPPDEGYLRIKAKAEAKLQSLFAVMRAAAA